MAPQMVAPQAAPTMFPQGTPVAQQSAYPGQPSVVFMQGPHMQPQSPVTIIQPMGNTPQMFGLHSGAPSVVGPLAVPEEEPDMHPELLEFAVPSPSDAAPKTAAGKYMSRLQRELQESRGNSERLLQELARSEKQNIKLRAALVERDNEVAMLQARVDVLQGMHVKSRPTALPVAVAVRQPLSLAEETDMAQASRTLNYPVNSATTSGYREYHSELYSREVPMKFAVASPASPARRRDWHSPTSNRSDDDYPSPKKNSKYLDSYVEERTRLDAEADKKLKWEAPSYTFSKSPAAKAAYYSPVYDSQRSPGGRPKSRYSPILGTSHLL